MKAILSSHDQKFWTEFLKMYQNSPCLWKHDINYDKEIKNAAIQRLIEKYKKVNPKANEKIVKRKIHSFRCAFQREHNKVINMRMCGKEYNPCLWYYDLLLFLTTGPITPNDIREDSSSSDEVQPLKNQLHKSNDSYFDIAGMKYASDLASLDPKQRILVIKAVKDAIFNAKQGKLTDTSLFVIDKSPDFDFHEFS